MPLQRGRTSRLRWKSTETERPAAVPRVSQTVKKGRRPQKQYNAKKETVNFRFFLFELLKMRLALAWSVFCFLRRAPLTVSADKAIRAPSFFRQDRAAIGIVTLRSPCVKHASVGCRAAHLRDWPKIFDRKREDFFVWKVEERRHTGVWPRDETNQTGKYSVSGTMLPESLCLSLQRRTPCPCSLSDSLQACQKRLQAAKAA